MGVSTSIMVQEGDKFTRYDVNACANIGTQTFEGVMESLVDVDGKSF